MKGKRAIELGAGPGLGGMAFALLGADVLLTDLADIVPLIRKNVDANFTSAALHGAILHQDACCSTITLFMQIRLQEVYQRASWCQSCSRARQGGAMGAAGREIEGARVGLGQRSSHHSGRWAVCFCAGS